MHPTAIKTNQTVHLTEKTSLPLKMSFQSLLPTLTEKMLSKLSETTKWNYVHIPDGLDKTEAILKMRFFIEHKVPELLSACEDVLPYLNERDVESIGSEAPTEMAAKFTDIISFLEQNGFFGQRNFGKSINFWSGTEARNKAFAASNELSDSDIPSICVMFDLCSEIQKTHKNSCTQLLPFAISKAYACAASGIVNVYISPEKFFEKGGLTVANNFWTAELPTLQLLAHRNIVQDIQIYIYNQETRSWDAPISLLLSDQLNLPLWRRRAHPLENPEHLPRFKQDQMSKEDQEKWIASKPRPSITLGKLKAIACYWRSFAVANAKRSNAS